MKLLIVFFSCLLAVISARNVRIIGGEESYAGEFPYAAAIYKRTTEGQYFCTGSVLSRQWVITSGQCVDQATMFTIILGAHKLSGDSASKETFATDTYVLHPEYDPLTLANDLGLIKFRAPITFTTYIKQLNLPLHEMSSDTTGVAYGWGQTSDADSNLSDVLRFVELTTVSDEECRITYGGQVLDNMVCLEGNYNEGTCYGDIGSPIIQYLSRDYTIVIAISSFLSGNGCETTDPSGYTEIYPYNDWIENVTMYS